jgi:glycosyltransferase involved in cell wall biosynthesis
VDNFNNTKIHQGIFWGNKKSLYKALSSCDVVLIHYWNHPLLTVFLADFDLSKFKVAIWCHNSGLTEPHIIPNYVAELADNLVFSSGSSLRAPNIDRLCSSSAGNFTVVASVRELQDFLNIAANRVIRKSRPRLLYVGTVAKSKMHPDSAKIFATLSRHGLLVRVVGGPDHEQLAKEAESLGGQIEFFGQVDNVIDFYKDSDIFVYPLRNDHYGTGEQVILEALASGLQVVAFDNAAEAEILNRFEGAKLANSTDEFINSVLQMADSPESTFQSGMQNSKRASSLFGPGTMTKQLIDVLHKSSIIMSRLNEPSFITIPKFSLLSIYARSSFFDDQIYRSLLNSPEQGIDIVLSAIKERTKTPEQISKWQTSTKSTPAHYLRYFPGNTEIANLVNYVDNLSI